MMTRVAAHGPVTEAGNRTYRTHPAPECRSKRVMCGVEWCGVGWRETPRGDWTDVRCVATGHVAELKGSMNRLVFALLSFRTAVCTCWVGGEDGWHVLGQEEHFVAVVAGLLAARMPGPARRAAAPGSRAANTCSRPGAVSATRHQAVGDVFL